MVILDTDHFSLWEGARGPEFQRLETRLEPIPDEEKATTIITYEEHLRGWLAFAARARSLTQKVAAYKKLQGHLDAFRTIQVLGFDDRAAIEYERLRKSRLGVGTMDLMIAAITRVLDATLLSRNLSDFRKIPGLRVEDWTA
jgi:tRNA(fMet)-specific endonuclease VapC